jgi:hypothetical protein
LQFIGEIAAGSWRRQFFLVCLIERDGLVHNLAQRIEHCAFVIAVTAAEDQSRRAADLDLIFFRPFDDFDVASAGVHDEW